MAINREWQFDRGDLTISLADTIGQPLTLAVSIDGREQLLSMGDLSTLAMQLVGVALENGDRAYIVSAMRQMLAQVGEYAMPAPETALPITPPAVTQSMLQRIFGRRGQ